MKLKVLLITILYILMLSGCNPKDATEGTISAEQVLTAVAETVAFNLSQTPPATPTQTATVTPTATFTATPTRTPSPSSSPIATGIGSLNITCENVAFISDVTIPDGTQFAPGAPFTKTWRLKNTGSCPWTTDFSIAFLNGNAMGGITTQKLTASLAPEFSRDLSVSLISPLQSGSFTGYWSMKNAAGVVFGDSFYVEIKVSGGGTSTGSPTVTVTGIHTSTATPILATSTNTSVPTETPTP